MSDVDLSPARSEPEPMPASVVSAQPGGGTCYAIELAWGHVRRWYLRTFRSAYVRRMAELMRGSADGCPHPVLDPRDVKFFVNRCTAHWDQADDPFTWRDRLPVSRWGLAELLLVGIPLAVLMVFTLVQGWWYVAIPLAVVLGWYVSFFRDPRREVPQGAGLVVSPADGTVVEIATIEFDEFIGGPAVRIGIFLSIFNVHLNRAPVACRVLRLSYEPGKFLDARNPASSLENEKLTIGFEEESTPHRRMIVRQIAGLLARRIVCGLKPGQRVERGEKFGMIKLGSRTELVLPASDDLKIETTIGQKVNAGSTIVARFGS